MYSAACAVARCLSVCLSRSCTVSKRLPSETVQNTDVATMNTNRNLNVPYTTM